MKKVVQRLIFIYTDIGGHSVITFAYRGEGVYQNENLCKQDEDGESCQRKRLHINLLNLAPSP